MIQRNRNKKCIKGPPGNESPRPDVFTSEFYHRLRGEQNISYSNAFRKLQKKTNDQTHSAIPRSLQYQNQAIMSQEKTTIGNVTVEHRWKTLKQVLPNIFTNILKRSHIMTKWALSQVSKGSSVFADKSMWYTRINKLKDKHKIFSIDSDNAFDEFNVHL